MNGFSFSCLVGLGCWLVVNTSLEMYSMLYSQAAQLDTETRVFLSTLVASVMVNVVADVAEFYRQREVSPHLI